MAISLDEKVAFLHSQQIFTDTDPIFLPQIAERLEEFTLSNNSNLFTEGEAGNNFYFIYKGTIHLWKEKDGEITTHANLESGDKLGEEAILLQKPRAVTATSTSDCHLLSLDLSDFTWMINQIPSVKENIIALAFSQQQSRKNNFDWLHKDETIYLLYNRHPIELIVGLFKPIAIAFLGVFLFFSSSLMPALSSLPRTAGYILFGLGILWTIWEGIEWKNDFSIVTNQRVIWLEKVLLQSANRQEAPLSAIQSINIHTTYLGRLLDYGTVTVRTYTGLGSLTISNLRNPKRFKEIVQEQILRLRDKGGKKDSDKMRQAIRQSFDESVNPLEDENIDFLNPKADEEKKKKFFEENQLKGTDIVYHKHWWIIFSKAWVVTIAWVSLTIYLIYSYIEILFADVPSHLLPEFYIPMILGIFITFLVSAYHYVDWKNDIYKVTIDSIVDSEHKPFGSENTQTASLKNIQSIENTKKGLLKLMLNFGDVNIMVADSLFTFVNVPNPVQVQQEIYFRQEQLNFMEKEEASIEERSRIADAIKMYHEEQINNQPSPPIEKPAYPALENEDDEY